MLLHFEFLDFLFESFDFFLLLPQFLILLFKLLFQFVILITQLLAFDSFRFATS